MFYSVSKSLTVDRTKAIVQNFLSQANPQSNQSFLNVFSSFVVTMHFKLFKSLINASQTQVYLIPNFTTLTFITRLLFLLRFDLF